MAELKGSLVRVHGVHGVAEVVRGGLVLAVILLLVLGEATGDGDEAGKQNQGGHGGDGYLTKGWTVHW